MRQYAKDRISELIEAVLIYNEEQAKEVKPNFFIITVASLNRLSKFIVNATADKVLVKSIIDFNKFRIQSQQDQLRMSDFMYYQKNPITGEYYLTNRKWDLETREQVMSKIQEIFREL